MAGDAPGKPFDQGTLRSRARRCSLADLRNRFPSRPTANLWRSREYLLSVSRHRKFRADQTKGTALSLEACRRTVLQEFAKDALPIQCASISRVLRGERESRRAVEYRGRVAWRWARESSIYQRIRARSIVCAVSIRSQPLLCAM